MSLRGISDHQMQCRLSLFRVLNNFLHGYCRRDYLKTSVQGISWKCFNCLSGHACTFKVQMFTIPFLQFNIITWQKCKGHDCYENPMVKFVCPFWWLSCQKVGVSDHVYCKWPRSTCRPIHRSIYRSTVKVLVDRLSVDSRSTIGRSSTDIWPILDRCLTDTWPIIHWQLIATYRPIYRPSVGRYIGRLSADTSVDCRPICRPRHL